MATQRNAIVTCCLLFMFAFASNPVEAHYSRHHHYRRHVVAQFDAPESAPLYIYHTRQPCYSLDDCDRKDYDESGTRGRMGLGASPFHPEGPGNAPD